MTVAVALFAISIACGAFVLSALLAVAVGRFLGARSRQDARMRARAIADDAAAPVEEPKDLSEYGRQRTHIRRRPQ